MRIISGSKKGKKLLLPNPKITRPLKDSVKENIFNILLHTREFKVNFENQAVIDFFAGSGSFGIECLSRGAKYVNFVEENNETRNTLFRNLDNNFEKSKFEIKKNNFFEIDFISLIQNIKPCVIFFDPPYAISELEKIFKLIENIKFKDLVIIIHIEKSVKVDFSRFKHFMIRQYGLSKIVFLKN